MAYTTKTYHAKTYPWTSIMAAPYSCDPTGVTNCAAAIESLKTNQANVGTIHVPKGTFKIATDLTIPVGMTLTMEAGAVISIVKDGAIATDVTILGILDCTRGGSFTIAADCTLTLTGIIEAGPVSLFSGAGTVSIGAATKLQYGEWTGGTGTTVLDGLFDSIGNYVDLPAAIAAIGATSQTLVIDRATTVAADATIPATLAIRVIKPGVFNIATTKTLTINGPLDAGPYQIFACTGTGKVVFGAGSVEQVYPQWWGATGNGTTNDAVAIQAALTAGKRVVFPTAAYKVNSGLTWNIDETAIDLCGSTLDFSAMTTGAALSPTVVNADLNERILAASANPVTNGTFLGPGGDVAALTCLNINYSADDSIAGGNFRNCSFLNFGKDVNFGDGAFMWNFDNCIFTLTSGTPTTYSINAPAATNSGENNTFTNCKWFNRKFAVTHANGNGQTILNQCSIDYCQVAITVTAGTVRVNGGSIEDNNDTDCWFSVDGPLANLHLTNVPITVMADKSAYAIFYTTANIEHGLWLENINLGTGYTVSMDLVAGTGGVHASGLHYYKDASKPMLGILANQIAGGDMEAASDLLEWDLTGTVGATPPAISAAQYHGGAGSCLFTGTSANSPRAKLSLPVKQGQHPRATCWYMASSLTGSGGTMYIYLGYVDKGGTAVGWTTTLEVTADSAWTRIDIGAYNCAPAGAAYYSMYFVLSGVSSGTALFYLDDVIVNIN